MPRPLAHRYGPPASTLRRCVADHLHRLEPTGTPLSLNVSGKGAVKLGKAIQQLDPNVKAKSESEKATKQAKQDLKTAQSQS